METKEFISRAENLLKKLDEIKKSPCELDECVMGYGVYPGLEDLQRDVVHLVYAYDRNLPVLSEMEKLCKEIAWFSHPFAGSQQWDNFFKKFHSLIQYFIQYLKDFG